MVKVTIIIIIHIIINAYILSFVVVVSAAVWFNRCLYVLCKLMYYSYIFTGFKIFKLGADVIQISSFRIENFVATTPNNWRRFMEFELSETISSSRLNFAVTVLYARVVFHRLFCVPLTIQDMCIRYILFKFTIIICTVITADSV